MLSGLSPLARAAATQGGGAEAPSFAAWTAFTGGVAEDLGGGSYELDATVAWAGAICGPLTGDFTCTIDPAFGATYGTEVGVAVGVLTDPQTNIYDGREAQGFYWPTGQALIYNYKAAVYNYSNLTEPAPNNVTYSFTRVGSTLAFFRGALEIFSRTMAGTLYLWSGHDNASGTVSTAVVRTST